MIDFELEHCARHAPSARIKVVGVGGAGGNTLNHMLECDYEHVEFIAINTDAQALKLSKAPIKLQIGSKSTKGLGAGANPELGRQAAEEDSELIQKTLFDADIVFLTGGLGGGTGSGALPVVARLLKKQNILTIAVVTKPFEFEGKRRAVIAEQALESLRKEVDTLIVIPNQKLLTIADQNVSLINAFGMVNGVVNQFVHSIADIIARPGHINVDFADVKTIMKNMGMAVMGTGRASGSDRAQKAAHMAISSSLLENVSIAGARGILLNISGNSKLGLHEVSTAASLIYEQAHEDANIILGSVIDDSMGEDLAVTIIATGFKHDIQTQQPKSDVQVTPTTRAYSDNLEAQPVAEPQAHAASPAPQETKKPEPQAAIKADVATNINPNDIEVPTILRKMILEKQAQQPKN